jgi:hypothetical protein
MSGTSCSSVTSTTTPAKASFSQVACDPDQDNRGAVEFLQRMPWLPALIRDLEQGRARLDA